MSKSQHVVPNSGKWSVKKSGSSKASKTFNTKKEATAYGRSVAKNQNAELYIHKKDGRIESKVSPRSSKATSKASSAKRGAK